MLLVFVARSGLIEAASPFETLRDPCSFVGAGLEAVREYWNGHLGLLFCSPNSEKYFC
jgi:hypothetical protein